jgi:hypothetical protein
MDFKETLLRDLLNLSQVRVSKFPEIVIPECFYRGSGLVPSVCERLPRMQGVFNTVFPITPSGMTKLKDSIASL